ncbi:MAG: methyltransferase type 12 [Desulfobacterales bacterium]
MFDCRATEPEGMDHPEFRRISAEQSFRFIGFVNRFLGGTRIVRRFVSSQIARTPEDRILRILDIGSGSCDIPISVCRWAEKKGHSIHFTCVENGRHAFRIGSEKVAGTNLPIEMIQDDIFNHFPEKAYDCAVGSMFFHHLSEAGILELVQRLRAFVRTSLLINDLCRNVLGYFGCRLLVWPLPKCVEHDALLSVRKSFKTAEMHELLGTIRDASIQVSHAPLFRIRAVVEFNPMENTPTIHGGTGAEKKGYPVCETCMPLTYGCRRIFFA